MTRIYKNQVMMILIYHLELRQMILQGYDFRIPIILFYIIQACLSKPCYATSADTLNKAPFY